jgi:glycosyltransferase involved in cell wall biosynthesis
VSTQAPMFTVLTATFNRAHTLPRVWDSLKAQTFQDFEWVVVDDGSSDGTADLVRGWAAQAPFQVRYLRQENKGKHVACNLGVAASAGEMIVILDSDDACVPAALERFAHHWRSIPDERRDGFYAVVCHCADPSGRRVGAPFPAPVIDAPGLDMRYRWKAHGEKWGTVRADLMRTHPFPDKPERTYIPESVVWDRLALVHLARFINEELRIYHLEPGEGSLGSSGDPARHAWGSMLQHRVVLNEHLEYFTAAPWAFFAAAIHYVRFSRHAGVGSAEQRRALTRRGAKALWWIAAPGGLAAWAVDRSRRWTSS